MTSQELPIGDDSDAWAKAAGAQIGDTQRRFRTILEDNRRHIDVEQQRHDELASRIADLRSRIDEETNNPEKATLRRELARLLQNQEGLSDKIAQSEDVRHRLLTAINGAELLLGYLTAPATSRDDGWTDAGDVTSTRLLAAQEEEHQRLAREIHDGPAQVLANAVFILGYCLQLVESDGERARTELGKLGEDLRAGLKEVRALISELRPGLVAEMGLTAALKHYGDQVGEQFGLHADIRIESSLPRLSSHREMAIYRIVQEAMRNVRKHSGVNEVRVDISRRGSDVMIEVEDKGVGFDPQKQFSSTRFGVHGMRERALLIDGEISIHSVPDEGTRIELRVPIGGCRHRQQGRSAVEPGSK